jgi:hypothetical protein
MRWHPLWAASCLMNNRTYSVSNSQFFPRVLGVFPPKKQKKVYTTVLSTFCMHHSFSVTIFTPSAFAFF